MVRPNATANTADRNDAALPEWIFRPDERRGP